MAECIPCELAVPAVISGSIPLRITSAEVVCPMQTNLSFVGSIFPESNSSKFLQHDGLESTIMSY
jgi:hypothetical protein